IAGNLKIDQAQYRELEAFSKFGSELDPQTRSILDKGIRNVEILKQAQFNPLPVEEQIAIVYCGVKGLLADIPGNLITEFEKRFLDHLRVNHKGLLNQLLDVDFPKNRPNDLPESIQGIILETVSTIKINLV
ncbi:MAG TPA: hypothetical protein VLH61_03540, partial [Bacteroidales bacterium]|nr:hypothetical protein [Bacteroidales bacterium]